MAALVAGIPHTSGLVTLNRQCSSGLQAFANIASSIRAGYIKVGMACGVESMSMHGFDNGVGKLNDAVSDGSKSISFYVAFRQQGGCRLPCPHGYHF